MCPSLQSYSFSRRHKALPGITNLTWYECLTARDVYVSKKLFDARVLIGQFCERLIWETHHQVSQNIPLESDIFLL